MGECLLMSLGIFFCREMKTFLIKGFYFLKEKEYFMLEKVYLKDRVEKTYKNVSGRFLLYSI